MYNMSQIPRFVCVMLMVAAFTSISCTPPRKDATALFDTTAFYDSAHHWWDIQDEDRVITPLPNQPKYKASDIVEIADNILLYQKSNGGWPKNYDMRAILTDEQKEKLLKAKSQIRTTTFDNGATHSHVEYMARIFTTTHDERYKDACLKGIDYILSAQYPNGGWPQFYPDTSGYRKHITFNDGAMIGVMGVLHRIVQNSREFSFVDSTRRDMVRAAFEHGITCILKCQIRERDTLTAWCQQHDHRDYRPRNARTFELASICNMESAEIVLFLMSLEHPNEATVAGIQGAAGWFDRSKVHGIRVETVAAQHAEFQYHSTDSDRVVIEDSSAQPIWPRFSELGTHRPMFCNRDGKPVYSLAEVERERRTGYGWYTYAPAEVLKKYPAWKKRFSDQSRSKE